VNVDEDIDAEPAAGEVPVTESSGTPDSGLSSCQEIMVGENDVSCDKPESDINLSQLSPVTADVVVTGNDSRDIPPVRAADKNECSCTCISST